VNCEALRIADVGEVAEEFEPFNEGPSRIGAPVDAERQHRTGALREVPLLETVPGT
jgi:hypothetical protein